jgi:hypothetical protein
MSIPGLDASTDLIHKSIQEQRAKNHDNADKIIQDMSHLYQQESGIHRKDWLVSLAGLASGLFQIAAGFYHHQSIEATTLQGIASFLDQSSKGVERVTSAQLKEVEWQKERARYFLQNAQGDAEKLSRNYDMVDDILRKVLEEEANQMGTVFKNS